MDTRTEIINEVMNYLSDFDAEQLKKINNVLYIVLDKYEVQERCTAVALADDSPDMILKKFIATKRLEGKSEKTLHQYNMQISHLIHALNKRIEDITTYDLRFYLAQYQEQHNIAKSTLKNIRNCIVTFFSWVTNEGFIKKNPAAALGTIKLDQVIRQPFSSDEMEKLRCACQCKRDRAIIEFFYSTGCRVSEVEGLNRTDVDFQNQEVIVTGKGAKQRRVYLSDVATMYLSEYLESRTDDHPCLFATIRSYKTKEGDYTPDRLSISSYEKLLKKLGKRANVGDAYPHKLRRTFATDMISRGAPIQDVATILGHSQVTTTQVYVSIDEQQVQSTYKRCIA